MSRKFPVPYTSNPVFRKKFRYQAQANEGKDADYITMGSLQNLMFVPTAGTTGVGLFSAVKLVEVEMWADSSASNTLTTISIDFLSPDSSNQTHSATGNSLMPAHLRVRPPKESAAGRWYAGQLLAQNTPTAIVASTPYAFSLSNTASGAIVDVTVDFTLYDYDSLNNQFTTICAGGTAGLIAYNNYLDNTSVSLGTGSDNWAVQGVGYAVQNRISAW